MSVAPVIETERFHLRPLGDADVTERYLRWLGDSAAVRYISARTEDLEALRAYVADRASREDVIFLGIFEKASGLHIGNIKYEPVDVLEGYAIMGILIGESSFRGRGVAGEVLQASLTWLRDYRQIRHVALGVHKANEGAIRAYERVGFRVASSPYLTQTHPSQIVMVWES